MAPNFWRAGLSLPLICVLLADPAARPLPGGPSAPPAAAQTATGVRHLESVRGPSHPDAVLGASHPVAVLGASRPVAGGRVSRRVAGRVFYVDAVKGDDDARGTGPRRAWRSLRRASEQRLRPGDTLLLRRGRRWRGTLELTGRGTAARPIVVGAYGKGARPRIGATEDDCVVVAGSYFRVSELRASRCGWAGFRVEGRYNDLWDVYADHNVTGVWFTPDGARNVLRGSQMRRNDRMSVEDDEPDNDSGAFGVLLNGDDNRVVGNLITGSYARSRDYVADGAAVEVYGGDRNVVTHNLARDNETFTELGHEPGGSATGNLFAHNVVTSSRPRGSFLVTRGPGHGVGPVRGTVAVHNSVHLPARHTIGFSCADGCSGRILTLRNNVVRVGGVVGYEDGSGIDDAGGVYHGKLGRFRPGRGSVRADPMFRGPRDLRLRAGSPAIGRGLRLGPSWYRGAWPPFDVAGRAVPRHRKPDSGAYQY